LDILPDTIGQFTMFYCTQPYYISPLAVVGKESTISLLQKLLETRCNDKLHYNNHGVTILWDNIIYS